jgi:hypothetical protein
MLVAAPFHENMASKSQSTVVNHHTIKVEEVLSNPEILSGQNINSASTTTTLTWFASGIHITYLHNSHTIYFPLIVTLVELDFCLVVYKTHCNVRLCLFDQLNEHKDSFLMSFWKESTHVSNSCWRLKTNTRIARAIIKNHFVIIVLGGYNGTN